jgi:hypothetical protein
VSTSTNTPPAEEAIMRINHPRPQLGRQRDLGVEFTDGVAVVESLHPERERALLQHGYTITADPEVEAPFQEAIGEPIIDLTTLTKAELRALLPEGAEVPKRANHADLVALVAELPDEPVLGSTSEVDRIPYETAEGAVTAVDVDGTVYRAQPRPAPGDVTSIVTLDADDEASDFED